MHLVFPEDGDAKNSYAIVMALSHGNAIPRNEYATQSALRRQVLHLLHHANDRQALASLPLMEVVCRETGTSDPVAALRRIVQNVFACDDERASTLRSALCELDCGRSMTNAQLARNTGVSRRHFQRRRAEAVAAIAQYARALVERTQSEARAESWNDRGRAGWRFERERRAFFDARDRGDVLEMRAIAGNLLRLSHSTAERTFSAACRADANVRLGVCDAPDGRIQGLFPAASLLLSAKRSLVAGNAAGAEDSARSALQAMPAGDAERHQALLLISQSRIARAMPFREPLASVEPPRRAWERLAQEIESARHLALRRAGSELEATARAALCEADRRGYRDLAARAAAALHASALARGEPALAGWWRARAIHRLLPTQDRVTAMGLFLATGYDERQGMDRLLNRVLYQRLRLVVPQIQGEFGERRAAVCALIAALLDSAVAARARHGDLGAALRRVERCGSALLPYAQRHPETLHAMLALALAAMTQLPWEEAFDRIAGDGGDGFASRTVTNREFEHLILHDEWAARTAGSA